MPASSGQRIRLRCYTNVIATVPYVDFQLCAMGEYAIDTNLLLQINQKPQRAAAMGLRIARSIFSALQADPLAFCDSKTIENWLEQMHDAQSHHRLSIGT
jgi:hypothetical protein